MTANNNQEQRVQQILWEALKLCGGARIAYLETACGGDAELRREVESLLDAEGQAGTFLCAPPANSVSTVSMAEKAGDRIGHYKLLEKIGEGGFGVVWMAEQEEPVRRRVALKIIKLGMDTKEVVARFEAERQALAMMDHPNIARVFDGGATDTGRPYFVMELVKGVPITTYCDARKLSTSDRLELFMLVCHAVQHAHQKGIIHRDLKPSNILVTVRDDWPVPKVIDFGVAKATQARLTEKTLFTRFQQWLGTPAYMSPEQAGLGSLDVDTRSDIYSLGVLLYELLTGRTPFDTQKLLAAGYDAVMQTIREEEPPKPSTRLSTLSEEELWTVAAKRSAEPSKLGGAVRGDLDWIVMKALEKDRQQRYETASDFARDLERYLRQEPVSAAAPSVGYRLAKYVRRNRAALTTMGVVVVLLLVGTIISCWQALRATHAERTTRTALDSAERANAATEAGRRQLEAALYASRVSGAYEAWEKGDVQEAEQLLDLCPEELREWEWHCLKRQCRLELASCSVVRAGDVGRSEAGAKFLGGGHILDFRAQLAFLPDGKEVGASLVGSPITRIDITAAKVIPWAWRSATNAEVELVAGGARMVALPKSNAVAEVLDLKTGKQFVVGEEPTPFERLVSEDGGWVAMAVTNGAVVVELAPNPARRFIPMTNRFRLHSLSPTGAILVTEIDRGYRIWETASGRLQFEINPPARPHHFCFDSAGRLLAISGPLESDWQQAGFGIAVRDITSGRRLLTQSSPTLGSLTKMWFAHDGQWLVMALNGYTDWHPSTDLRIVDTATGEEVFALAADNMSHHPGRAMWGGKPEAATSFLAAGVNDVAVSPDGNLLALGVCDRTIQLISLAVAPKTGTVRQPVLRTVLRGHRGAVLAVKFSPDGKRLASIDQLGVVKIWDPASEVALALPQWWAEHTSISPDATTVLWTDVRKEESRVLDLVTREHRVLAGFRPLGDYRDIRLLDRYRFASRGEIWRVDAEVPAMTLDTSGIPIDHLAATDDGRYVATIGGEVAIWDTTTGKIVGEQFPVDNESYGGPYPYHQGSKLVSLTADGRKVAVCQGGEPNRVQVRRTGIGKDTPGVIVSFPGHSPVLFGPQGDWLLSRTTRRTFQRVDAATGRVLREYTLRSKLDSLNPALSESQSERLSLQGWLLSPDGRYAVCFDFGADLSVVDLQSGEVLFEVGHPVLRASAAFTADNRRVLVPGRDQRVEIWSLETKSKIVTLPQRGVFIRFNRDGKRAVVISPEGQLSVLDGTPLDPTR